MMDGALSQGQVAGSAAKKPAWQPSGRVMVKQPIYDTTAPTLPMSLRSPAILIFSKQNGYSEQKQVLASDLALVNMAEREGWSYFATDNAAVFNAEQLKQFQAVVWNNTSGDLLTEDQRQAFKSYMEGGGGFVGIHGAGGDPTYTWRWYVDTLIGAQFVGIAQNPQFQQATIKVEDSGDPATRLLPPEWSRVDEWYSFAASPREKVHVLAAVDETTYSARAGAKDLRMGDHPVVWKHCVGRGRAFYSALGHTVDSYEEPLHLAMLQGGIAWAAGVAGDSCPAAH
jgi:uncharacterized protein